MDEFGQGSESFADEGLDIMKEGSQQVAHQAGRMARNGISKATRGIRKGIKSAVKKAGKAAAEAIKKQPLVKTLIVSGDELAEARLKVKRKGNALNANYEKIAASKRQ